MERYSRRKAAWTKVQPLGVEAIKRKADAHAYKVGAIICGLMFHEGLSSNRALARRLNELETPTRRGGRWSGVHVADIRRRVDPLK
jgi:hypothetical protein